MIVAAHAAIVVALLHSTLLISRAADSSSVQVSFIPPRELAPLRFAHFRPQSLSTALLSSVSAPAVPSFADSGNGSGAHQGNEGLNADWVAEAHRAVKAYEIRRDQPPVNPISGASRDYWEMQREHVHRAGDRYKTESGDWIVWIDDHCYKIAQWHRGDPNDNGSSPQVVCPGQTAPPAKAE